MSSSNSGGKTTAFRFKPQLDGSIRRDGPFECTVLPGTPCDPVTRRPWPEFKYVRFGESCNDWTCYQIHEQYIQTAPKAKGPQREVTPQQQKIGFGF